MCQVQGLSSTQGEGNANLHSVLWSAQQKIRVPIRTLRIAKTVSSGCFGAWDRVLQAKKLKTGSVKLRRVGFSNEDLLELRLSVKPSKEGVRRGKRTSAVERRTLRMSLCMFAWIALQLHSSTDL